MARPHAYPPALAEYVLTRWPAGQSVALSRASFEEALAVAFQASMTEEEGRPTRFRMLLTPPNALPASGVPNEGVLRLRFDRTRPLNPDELRRLSPSTPFETALIGVYPDPNEGDALRIWGIAHSGPAWLAPTWGGRVIVPNWSHDPIIHVTGPGQLAVRSAGKLIGAIERGHIVDAMMDVFDSQWLPEMFATVRNEARAKHALRQSNAASPTLVDNSLVALIGQQLLRRTIQLIRGARRGGLLLVIDSENEVGSDQIDGLRPKYRFAQDEPTHRYRTLLSELLEAVAASTDKPSVGWSDFANDTSERLQKIEQSVFEMSRLLSNLTAIDGALVVDKRFRLLGFGAEVSSELPSPPAVWRARDVEGKQRSREDFESVGTRHRAAYRFVNEHPSGLAIVVSHDGGVSFVSKREADVVFWEQSVSP
jgi:DisA bacterial checkpoint controller nucleotide-binding